MKISALFIVCFATAVAAAADVSERRMVWAHYVPWNCPENLSIGVAKHYNYPVFAGNSGNPRADEVKTAIAQGVDGFFMDVVVRKNGSAAFWDLGEFLRAAEGTDFQVSFCLDVKTTVETQVKVISKMLAAFGSHPNFPVWKGRPLAMTYTFRAWTPEEWLAILDGVEKNAGVRPYLIANTSLGYKRFTRDFIEKYADVFDMAYCFGNGGLSGQDPAGIDREIHSVCVSRGKTFMGTVWPGYYGAWINGRNDYYQPYCGVDRAMAGYLSARALDTPWLHLTTWNDYDETALAPRRLTAGTAALTRAFSKELKGERPDASPDVLFAYHREEFPGTLLRFEAMRLPSADMRPIIVGGRLRSPDGECRVELPAKSLTGDWSRVEWLIPSTSLARWPLVVPEFAMKDADGSGRKGVFPAMMFVEPWLEDAETVRMTFRDVAAVDGKLAVEYRDGLINAKVSFEADRKIKRAVLFRNARPIGQFDASPRPPQMNVHVSGGGTYSVTLSNAVFRAANRLFAKTGTDAISYTPSRLDCRRVPKWAPSAFRTEGPLSAEMEIASGKTKKRMTLAEFAAARRVKAGNFVFTLSPDLTIYDREPLDAKSVSLELSLAGRPPDSSDVFWVRFEGKDGSAASTVPIWPFAKNVLPVARNLIETDVTLEKTQGASGQPGYREFFTPPDEMPLKGTRLVTAEVSPLVRRASQWKSDSPLNLRGDRPWTEDKSADGRRCVRLPLRAWPSGTFKISFKYVPECPTNRVREVISKTGGQDGPSLYLLPDNRLEIRYSATGPSSHRPICHAAAGKTVLSPGERHDIRMESDSRTFRLFVNGKEDASVVLPPLRVYGNLTVKLYGEWDAFTVE